jgi:transposase InsO family protein
MPWQETEPVNERMKFVVALQRGLSMTEACRQFGISRKTGYKILARFQAEGPEALRDRSRAPKTHPNRTPPELEAAILRLRRKYPTWGSKKLLAALERDVPDIDWPARSTIDQILQRAGVVTPRKRRNRTKQPSSPPVLDAAAPNDAWSIDYKGWFRVGDGTRCDPLTVNDVATRSSLVCRAMVAPKLEDVKLRLQEAFGEYGLPRQLLSDNGPPFASNGLQRLSRLGVWLIRLGVEPVFIQPGKPYQNGRHERFHDTLRVETAAPPKQTIAAQQRAFSGFQVVYNEERPHEALDMRVPAELYDFSPRQLPAELPEHEYEEGLEVRKVRRDGSMKWDNGYVFVGEAFRGERVGLKQVDDEAYHVFLGPRRLGSLHTRSRTIVPINEDRGGVTHVPGQSS